MMTFHKMRPATLAFMGGLAMMSASGAIASEGGGTAYPLGAEDFMAGAAPPPGTYLINYAQYYTADTLKTPGADVDIDLTVWADVVRLIHITPLQILGANYGVHVFFPFVKLDLSVSGTPVDVSESGLGDIVFSPLILSWHWPNTHSVFALDFYAPTGDFSATRAANIGRNYWTLEPVFAVTHLTDGGLDLSAKFMYDFNRENDDTNYKTGQEFHFDYTVAQKFGNFAAGVGGYYYTQVTDDELNGAKVADSEGRVFAIGPQIKYDYKGMSFIGKWHHELDVKNRPEGDKFWFKFIMAF